jgi:hypothetical protein
MRWVSSEREARSALALDNFPDVTHPVVSSAPLLPSYLCMYVNV